MALCCSSKSNPLCRSLENSSPNLRERRLAKQSQPQIILNDEQERLHGGTLTYVRGPSKIFERGEKRAIKLLPSKIRRVAQCELICHAQLLLICRDYAALNQISAQSLNRAHWRFLSNVEKRARAALRALGERRPRRSRRRKPSWSLVERRV